MTDTATPNPANAPDDAPGRAREGAAPRRRRQAQHQPRAKQQQQVHPVLQQLFELYPTMFGAQFLPLKLGVFQDLLAQHPELFKRDELKIALGLHARSTRYLESVAAGHPRHDLQGQAVEPVAPEHVHYAIMEVFRRRQARSNADLRPYVLAQLMTAIEASGLSREDYTLQIRTQGEASNELLEMAFSELAKEAAKREALLKAFEASGKTAAEFADMYGMNPDEVAHTLARAQASQSA
ncbi:ProQ/FINO family protein [Polaromonas sp. OV174]|uniref:ProQ/FINO family protein n=1 Tax=Polaromonas sp. OV174 TaxID=1855300 RepID=UPI0008E08515|nr:ProQ/FINO family protein [Polaromonas sp. OV174]SFB67064.1 ProQ/FINO family protein [Polaromonas sp. OV174]